jgi:hypothetical protein
MTIPTPTTTAAGPATRHQQAVMIWLAVFPTLTVLNLALGDWLHTVSPVLRTFVLATIAVPIISYGLMPQLHRLRRLILISYPTTTFGVPRQHRSWRIALPTIANPALTHLIRRAPGPPAQPPTATIHAERHRSRGGVQDRFGPNQALMRPHARTHLRSSTPLPTTARDMVTLMVLSLSDVLEGAPTTVLGERDRGDDPQAMPDPRVVAS